MIIPVPNRSKRLSYRKLIARKKKWYQTMLWEELTVTGKSKDSQRFGKVIAKGTKKKKKAVYS